MDPCLDGYLRATDVRFEQECLGELIAAVAEPIIRRTVHSRLAGRWDDMDDVCSEARLELLLHLRRIKGNPAGARGIEDFPAYVGTLAGNTCHHYFRRRRTGRARLRKQVRFLLQEPEFQICQNGCGLSGWAAGAPSVPAAALDGVIDLLEGNRNLAALLTDILERAGGPVEFEALVDAVARLWRVPPDADARDEIPGPIAAHNAESSIDRKRYAARLWQEIRLLPRPQRVALLLNLRDGRGTPLLALFPLSGVASFMETAAALVIEEAQLAKMWNELPWDDNTIAGFLGVTRQQVINLRTAARKRLSNRMGELPG